MVKRLGCWIQGPPAYTPQEFFDVYFLSPPYFAALEYIITEPSKGMALGTARDWFVSLLNLTLSYPNIEIPIMVAFDMQNEIEWSNLKSFLDVVKNYPTVYSVGISGEHVTYGAPAGTHDYTIGYLLNNGLIAESEVIALFDRAKSLVELRGLRFINYFIYYGSATLKYRYPSIFHTNWPMGRTHENSLSASEWLDPATARGCSAGIFTGGYNPDAQFPHPTQPPEDPYQPLDGGWNQATINKVIEHGVSHGDDVRHFITFATGFASEYFDGVSGKRTRAFWDIPLWRQYVWEKQQQYPLEFILSTALELGNVEINVEGVKADTPVTVKLRR